GAIGELDAVGDSSSPALYLHADATHVFFRMRVSGDPLLGAGLRPVGWGAALDVDGDPGTYELLVMLDGNRGEVVLYRNTTQALPDDPRAPADLELAAYGADTHARAVLAAEPFLSSFDADDDYFVDWAVDWTDLEAEGVSP